ncbi:hypothetical protein [Nostoc sp.]|uniref:hypothetical protein n=1 Tax=Nostoc sp. TaxID=1180 RepID=UPI002FF5E1D1
MLNQGMILVGWASCPPGNIRDAHVAHPTKAAKSFRKYATPDIFVESELGDKPKLISFLTDTKGNITSVAVPLEPTVKEILFTRIPESSSR